MEIIELRSDDTGHRQLANDLYAHYLRLLRPYNAEIQALNVPELLLAGINEIKTVIDTENTYFFFIKDVEVVGFFILGFTPNSYSPDDLYIQEFCIREEYQHRGYGRKALEWIAHTYPKDASMFILKSNTPAWEFWNKVMPKLGFKELASLGLVSLPEDNEYRPNKAVTDFLYWSKNGIRP